MTTAEIVARCIATHDEIDWDALTESQRAAYVKRAALIMQRVVWSDGAKT